MKRLSFVLCLCLSVMFSISCSKINSTNKKSENENKLKGNKTEEYYMITFQSGLEYWKGAYNGFQDAAALYGVKVIYTGSTQYDINQEVTIFQQIVSKKPAGIAISCNNPSAFEEPIKKAISLGIPVVTFDADSPNSNRYTFLATDNKYAGYVAAKVLSEQIGKDGGEVAIITLPSQQNHDQRVEGFETAINTEFKNLKIVQIGNGKSDQTEAAKLVSSFLQANPNIKGIFCTDATGGVGAAIAIKESNKIGKVKIVSFDTDKGTLDAVRSGVISATIAQGTYVMGYQAMNFLFQLQHDLVKPTDRWKEKGIKPLPNFVDTGVNVVTKENVNDFYEVRK